MKKHFLFFCFLALFGFLYEQQCLAQESQEKIQSDVLVETLDTENTEESENLAPEPFLEPSDRVVETPLEIDPAETVQAETVEGVVEETSPAITETVIGTPVHSSGEVLNETLTEKITEEVSEEVDPDKFPMAEWNPAYVGYINKNKVKSTESLINPPPEKNSADYKRELSYLEELTKNRTTRQEELFLSIGHDPVLHFVEALGFENPRFKNVKALFYNALVELNPRILEEKWRYQRARPYQVDSKVELWADKAFTASYPSLYSAQSWMVAHIMTDLYPEYDYVWAGWAKEVSKLYEVVGLQFPTDTDAGRIISLLVYERYKKTIEFQSDFLNADIELLDYEIDIDEFEKKYGTFNLPKAFP